MIKVCGLVGSLRAKSYNKGLMRAAVRIALEEGIEITVFDRIGELPLFNQDLEKNLPDTVIALREAVSSAEGLYIVTPEYNYSVPGILKNAIDWASRPPMPTPLAKKPVAIAGASMGMGGSIRAQMHLRQIFVQTECLAMLKPEILIPHAHERFTTESELTDENTLEIIRKQMINFKSWIHQLKV